MHGLTYGDIYPGGIFLLTQPRVRVLMMFGPGMWYASILWVLGQVSTAQMHACIRPGPGMVAIGLGIHETFHTMHICTACPVTFQLNKYVPAYVQQKPLADDSLPEAWAQDQPVFMEIDIRMTYCEQNVSMNHGSNLMISSCMAQCIHADQG